MTGHITPDLPLIDLPPRWSMDYSATVGFSCLDGNGQIVAQHSRDDNAFRRVCWRLFYDRLALEVAKIRRPGAQRATEKDRAVVERIADIMSGEVPL